MSDTDVREDDESAHALSVEVSKLDDSSRTISQFCDIENMSLSSYFKLKRLGLAPDEMRVPHTKIVRILPAAHRAWRARMQQLAREEAAQLETERRRAQSSAAGKLAAAARQGALPRKKPATPARVARSRKR